MNFMKEYEIFVGGLLFLAVYCRSTICFFVKIVFFYLLEFFNDEDSVWINKSQNHPNVLK